MSFVLGNPALMWGLLAAAIPILIHLFYRRRPRPTPFPAIDFVLRARKETQRRVRLKKVLLFLARTSLLCALALALAKPRAMRPDEAAAASARGPSATAIVLDASASMGYLSGGKSLFDRAKADALETLDSMGNDEPALAVICGGPAAPTAGPPTFDKAEVRRALRGAELTYGHADLTACVAAAMRGLSDSAAGVALGKRLVIATDFTGSAWRLDAPAPTVQTPQGPVRPEVSLLDAARGAELPNAAVVGVELQQDPAVGPRGYRITATIANYGKKPQSDLNVQLRAGPGADAAVVVRGFVDVPPNGTAKKTLAYNFPAGGPTAVTVALPGDALAIDDTRSLTLTVPREVKAMVVNGSPSPVKYRDEAYFVEAALSSPASPVRPTLVDIDDLERAKFSEFDVVFLLNVRTLGAKVGELKSFVEKGGGLFIAVGDQVDPDHYSEELKALLPQPLHLVKTAAERGQPGAANRAARFGQVAWDHPALSIFNGPAREGFEGVRTFRYVLLKPADKARVIATYDDGAPALVEGRRGLGNVLLYTSTVDRDWSDWTIRTSFLPAIQRFAAYLTGGLEGRRDTPSLVHVSRPIEAEETQKITALVAPGGEERPWKVTGPKPTFTPDRPGIWQVKIQDAAGTRVEPKLGFAVHADPRESDTVRVETAEITAYFGGSGHAKVAAEKSGASEGRSIPLWSMLLALGVALFLAEGLLLA